MEQHQTANEILGIALLHYRTNGVEFGTEVFTHKHQVIAVNSKVRIHEYEASEEVRHAKGCVHFAH